MRTKRRMPYLARLYNCDGRLCAWGIAHDRDDAEKEARRQWDSHNCYPNETKGDLYVRRIDARDGAA